MNKYYKDWIYFDRNQEQTIMVKDCKTCKHQERQFVVPSECNGCGTFNDLENWEPKEAMDIWKEAPEGAEYYNLSLKRYYYVAALSVFYWMEAEKRWGKSELSIKGLAQLIDESIVIKRPQAEQPVYETEAAKADRELGKELKVYPAAEGKAECKNPDKSNCKYCPSKYHDKCNVIVNEKAEQEEAMDIWKEAPDGATHVCKNTGWFWKKENDEYRCFAPNLRVWLLPGQFNCDMNGVDLVERPQAEQEEPKEWEPCQKTIELIHSKLSSNVGELKGGYRNVQLEIYQQGMQTQCNVVAKMIEQSQAEKEREEFKARLKQWVDANVWDGEDRKGCKGDSASFGPDDLQELFDDALDFIIESGMAKRLADKGE